MFIGSLKFTLGFSSSSVIGQIFQAEIDFLSLSDGKVRDGFSEVGIRGGGTGGEWKNHDKTWELQSAASAPPMSSVDLRSNSMFNYHNGHLLLYIYKVPFVHGLQSRALDCNAVLK